MHRINHPFASEPSGGVSLLLSYPASEETSERVRALQHSSGGRGLTGEKRNGSRENTRSVRWPAPLRASALKEHISLKEYMGDRVFLKMSYHPCVSGCGRSLAPQDGHDHCLTCLSIQHAEEAFVDVSCSSCGDMTISELRNRLRCVKHGGVPLMLLATAPPWPIPMRKDLLSQRRGTLWHPRPDLWKLHVWSLDGTRRF